MMVIAIRYGWQWGLWGRWCTAEKGETCSRMWTHNGDDAIWWGKEAQKKRHSHSITPRFHGLEQLSEWNTCSGSFLCLIYPFYGPKNWWNIVLLQCRAYIYSFLCMKYIPALINMCFRDDKPHFGPFLTQYICFMQFRIPSQRSRWSAYALFCPNIHPIYTNPLVQVLLFTLLLGKCMFMFSFGALLSDHLTKRK